MAILTGHEIRRQREKGNIVIEPFDEKYLGPNSYDVHLGNEFKVVLSNSGNLIDPRKMQCCAKFMLGENDEYTLFPGTLLLGTTVEKAGSDVFVPMIDGRSSVGRMGLFVHVTAGFGDIGFKSNWTLELVSTIPIVIWPGMRVAQVIFHEAKGKIDLYDGNYADQTGPRESMFWKNK